MLRQVSVKRTCTRTTLLNTLPRMIELLGSETRSLTFTSASKLAWSAATVTPHSRRSPERAKRGSIGIRVSSFLEIRVVSTCPNRSAAVPPTAKARTTNRPVLSGSVKVATAPLAGTSSAPRNKGTYEEEGEWGKRLGGNQQHQGRGGAYRLELIAHGWALVDDGGLDIFACRRPR